MDHRSNPRISAIGTLTSGGSEDRPRGSEGPTPESEDRPGSEPDRLSFARQYRTIPPLPNTSRRPTMTPPKKPAKNVLWIMCDQLRYDYLGCTGHPVLKTPNIDAMARRGVLFLERLCAVADLRPVADVVLYRPLHALARLALERLAAARRRTDARRSPEEDRRPQRAGRQDAYGARPGRPEESRHPPGLHHRRARVGMRLRTL